MKKWGPFYYLYLSKLILYSIIIILLLPFGQTLFKKKKKRVNKYCDKEKEKRKVKRNYRKRDPENGKQS